MNFVCKFDVRHDGHQPLLELWLKGPSNKKVTANIPWSSNQSNLLECSQNCSISHLLKTYFDHVRFSFAVLTIQRLKTNDTQHSAILNYRFQYKNCNTPNHTWEQAEELICPWSKCDQFVHLNQSYLSWMRPGSRLSGTGRQISKVGVL